MRAIAVNVGIETSSQPDPGTPTETGDIITLGFLQSNYSEKPQVTGSMATPQSIVAGTGIAFVGTARQWFNTWYIQGSGGAVDVSASSQIADGAVVGQRLRLVGCHDTNTVKLEDGNNLKLSASERILSQYSILELEWDGSDWVEVSWNNI